MQNIFWSFLLCSRRWNLLSLETDLCLQIFVRIFVDTIRAETNWIAVLQCRFNCYSSTHSFRWKVQFRRTYMIANNTEKSVKSVNIVFFTMCTCRLRWQQSCRTAVRLVAIVECLFPWNIDGKFRELHKFYNVMHLCADNASANAKPHTHTRIAQQEIQFWDIYTYISCTQTTATIHHSIRCHSFANVSRVFKLKSFSLEHSTSWGIAGEDAKR